MSENGEEVSAEAQALHDKLSAIVSNNQELERQLAGKGVGVNQFMIVSMRLDLLLNKIFPETEDRYRYEIESAQLLQHILMQIQEQTDAPQTQLLVPESPGKLHIPK